MFGLFKEKKSIISSGILQNFTDIHSHILFGVDDGIKEKEEALNTLDELELLGIKNIYLTPHVMSDFFANNPDFLENRFNELKSAYKGRIKLKLAAEYMLDNKFDSHLNNDRVLTIADKYLLIETSYLNPPIDLQSFFNRIWKKGYYIIFAHPERYLYMNKQDYIELNKQDFIFFQLNILSLTGYYGDEAKKKSHFLLERDFYKFIGSDIHNLNFHIREFGRKIFTTKQIEKINCLKENNNFLFLP